MPRLAASRAPGPGLLAGLLLAGAVSAAAEAPLPEWRAARSPWSSHRAASRSDVEDALAGAVSPAGLAAVHERLADLPHRAGTPGGAVVASRIAEHFRSVGLEVEEQVVAVLLARPLAADVEVVTPERIALSVAETPVAGDPWSRDAAAEPGFNAYSASGDVTAPVVYANFGRKEDFERLAELGVDVGGKVVVARYGGNFRGYKAKYAELAGAAALILYLDPADSGWAKGAPWPEGGWANESSIQRGSLLTLPYPGDPLTPGEPAPRHARGRYTEPDGLPTIPVQPVGWGAAREILARMTGAAVPEGWQGGLPFTYRLEGGAALTVRVHVEQVRERVAVTNVTGTLRGARWPDELVVLGAHHDAWLYGASDPTAGTMLVLEAARVFGEAARRGVRPARTLVFAAWDAEEFGIIGSTEWVEAHRAELERGGVAYVNADMAAMGPELGISASPFLAGAAVDAAASVRQARESGDRTALAAWRERAGDAERPRWPAVGMLGGGSDHVGFLCHALVPSIGLGASGSDGSSYHTAYDDLAWYRAVVGADYEPARMLAQVAVRLLFRLADADVVPFDSARVAADLRAHLEGVLARADELGVKVDGRRLDLAAQAYALRAAEVEARLAAAMERGALRGEQLAAINATLRELGRAWAAPDGLPGRPWYRNLLVAPDETSGYAPWPLPALRKAVEERDARLFARLQEEHVAAFRAMETTLAELEAQLPEPEAQLPELEAQLPEPEAQLP